MLPLRRVFNGLCSIAILISCAAAIPAQTSTSSPAPPLVVEGLGRGTVALDGQWQFHLGDDLTWADPAGRTYTLAWGELREWVGERAQAGRMVPKGFPRSNKFGPGF